MKKYFILMIVPVLLASGCGKEEAAIQKSMATNKQSDAALEESGAPFNAANPYDQSGKEQALLLTGIMGYVKTSGDTTQSGITRFVQQQYKQKNISLPDKVYGYEQTLRKDYRQVLFANGLSTQAGGYLTEMNNALQALEEQYDYKVLYKSLVGIEANIDGSKLPGKEKAYLFVTASIMRHSAYVWMNLVTTGPSGQPLKVNGIGSFFRKVAAVICAIGAGASVAAWHYIKGSPYDQLVSETARWGFIVGYYTGWWPDETW